MRRDLDGLELGNVEIIDAAESNVVNGADAPSTSAPLLRVHLRSLQLGFAELELCGGGRLRAGRGGRWRVRLGGAEPLLRVYLRSLQLGFAELELCGGGRLRAGRGGRWRVRGGRRAAADHRHRHLVAPFPGRHERVIILQEQRLRRAILRLPLGVLLQFRDEGGSLLLDKLLAGKSGSIELKMW